MNFIDTFVCFLFEKKVLQMEQSVINLEIGDWHCSDIFTFIKCVEIISQDYGLWYTLLHG